MDEIKGKRIEGWLLATQMPRITPKSAFLRKLERMQNPKPVPVQVTDNVTPLKQGKREA